MFTFFRKGTKSINGMFVGGPSGLFYYCSTSSPGRDHDSLVLRSTNLFKKLMNGWRPFQHSVLLGDSAYKSFHDFLATPFSDKTSVPREQQYNRAFCSARNVIERNLGMLKNKWRVLLEGIRLKDIEQSSRLIQVCVALHNFVILHGSSEDYSEDTSDDTSLFDFNTIGPLEEDRPRSGRPKPTKQKIMEKYF